MVNTNIKQITSNIENLKKEAGTYQESLRSSPSYAGETLPSDSDLANQQQLERIQGNIQRLEDEKKKAQWYPKGDKTSQIGPAGEKGVKTGILGSALDWISRPLYGVVGATKHFTGQGKGTLAEDMAENIKRGKSTFGDVLSKSGMPYPFSAPLGFVLDIGLDPVNWATMGTGAFIPRVAAGAIKGLKSGKGVAQGVKLALESGALKKATTVASLTPVLRKTESVEKLAEKSIKATEAWQGFYGKSVEDIVRSGSRYREKTGEVFKRFVDSVPGGREFAENFKYDPVGYVRQARLRDILLDKFGAEFDVAPALKAYFAGESIEPFRKKAAQKVEEIVEQMRKNAPAETDFSIDTNIGPSINKDVLEDAISAAEKFDPVLSKKIREGTAEDIIKYIDDAANIATEPKIAITDDVLENTIRLAGESLKKSGIEGNFTMEEIKKLVNSGALGDTGVKWYDDFVNKIKAFKIGVKNRQPQIFRIGKQTLDQYDEALKIFEKEGGKIYNVGKTGMDRYGQAISLFKIAKVAGSPSAWMNAVAGNLLMLHMATGRISPRFLVRLKESSNMFRDKAGSAAKVGGLIREGQKGNLLESLIKNRTAASGTLGGLDPLFASEEFRNSIVKAQEAGLISSKISVDDVIQNVGGKFNELQKDFNEEIVPQIINKLSPEQARVAGLTGVEGGTAEVKKLFKDKMGQFVTKEDLPPSFFSSEVFEQEASRRMLKYIEDKLIQDPNSAGWRSLNFLFNKLPSGYEKIDQSYKLALFLTATVDGFTENELRTLSRLIKIEPEELLQLGRDEAKKLGITLTENRYRIPGERALELANVMFLNYNAMPSAVRFLRNLPLMGSPFVSFMYGMGVKTGQTLMYNPSAFTKVNFAMKEFGGQKTPFEKQALESPYYSYLKQPGMLRLPFLDEYPMYVNLASMIPYYSFNMFNPSEGSFNSNALPTKFIEYAQRSPFLKDPVGATMFDYLIQPLILDEATAPQGQFGQALYPTNAGAGTKSLYGARTLAEAFVPNLLTPAGLATGLIAPGITEAIPSYRWRSLAQATQGKNQLGISSKESKVSRVGRNLAGIAGIQVQSPMNLTYSKKKKNKK